VRTVFDCFLDPKFVKEHGAPMLVSRDGVLLVHKRKTVREYIARLGIGGRRQKVKESVKAHKMFTVKRVVETKSLGKMVLTSAYVDGAQGEAIPTLFLTEAQKKAIAEADTSVLIKLRDHVDNGEMYICYPTKCQFEKIVSL